MINQNWYTRVDRMIRMVAWQVHDLVGWPFQALLKSPPGQWIRRNTEPNHWTLLRFPMTLVIAMLLYFQQDVAAFWVYILSVLTDRFDGEFARLDNKCSSFGTLLDTVADSVMQAAILIGLTWRYPALVATAPLWRLPIIAVGLEVVRLLGGLIIRTLPVFTRRHHEHALQPNMSGKFKMAAMAFSIVALLLGHVHLAQNLMWWAIALSIYSMLRHLVDALQAPRSTPR